MVEKLKTFIWFFKRPSYWFHAFDLILRKFRIDFDSSELRSKSTHWARERSVSIRTALLGLGLLHNNDELPVLEEREIQNALIMATQSSVVMGGAGDLRVLYSVTSLLKAEKVLETGVAYGWSSLAILAAQRLSGLDSARLVSVDMPYPKLNNDKFVGVVVPNIDRARWTLIREPDRFGINKAIKLLGGHLDCCHYDSDKSWYGRRYAYPLLWRHLRVGGVFISDDIQDNFAFRDFVESTNLPFFVVECEGKFVGLVRKT